MLILGVAEGERVLLDCGTYTVAVMVTGVDRGRVQLGFDAPRCVVIDREEVAERKAAEVARQARQDVAAQPGSPLESGRPVATTEEVA
jgi:carbon storage regulator CsrA